MGEAELYKKAKQPGVKPCSAHASSIGGVLTGAALAGVPAWQGLQTLSEKRELTTCWQSSPSGWEDENPP